MPTGLPQHPNSCLQLDFLAKRSTDCGPVRSDHAFHRGVLPNGNGHPASRHANDGNSQYCFSGHVFKRSHQMIGVSMVPPDRVRVQSASGIPSPPADRPAAQAIRRKRSGGPFGGPRPWNGKAGNGSCCCWQEQRGRSAAAVFCVVHPLSNAGIRPDESHPDERVTAPW
jgi:hypothetical protein